MSVKKTLKYPYCFSAGDSVWGQWPGCGMFQALRLGTEAPGRAQGLGLGFGLNPEVLEFAELCVGSQLVTEFGIGVKSLGGCGIFLNCVWDHGW